MPTVVAPLRSPGFSPAVERPIHILPIPWRDPNNVSPAELAEHIGVLERACEDHPKSPDLRTCLGMAYAMNYQVYKSMDALEKARQLDNTQFFAQFKYAELLYRLRALPRAEEQTSKAIELAGNGWELSMARKQSQEIRRLIREGTQKPEWNKPLWRPSLILVAMFVLFSAIAVIYR
jgi:hypothetical protein